MAKWTFDVPISGGMLLDDITQARLVGVTIDFRSNRIDAQVEFGKEAGGVFTPSPAIPPGGKTRVVSLNEHADVLAAWNNFERKVFQRAATDEQLPPGTDSD